MEEINISELRDECLKSLYTCAENVSKYIEDEGDRAQEFNKLRNCVIEYCKMELQEEGSKKALQSIEVEMDLDNWASLQKQYENNMDQFSKKRAKFDNHPFVKEFEKHVKIARNNGEQDSQDVAITQTTNCNIDPISKKQIINPMRNNICNHVYEKDTIESIIRNKKNKGCPYVGCLNKQPMLAQHLTLDEELQMMIRRTQQSSQLSQDL